MRLECPIFSERELTITSENDLNNISTMEQQIPGIQMSDRSNDEDTAITIEPGSIISKNKESHIQNPVRSPRYTEAKEQPNYAILNGDHRHVTAHNIWLANKRSVDACKACRAANTDCWVDLEHVACARCTGMRGTARQCGAKGTKFNIVDKG